MMDLTIDQLLRRDTAQHPSATEVKELLHALLDEVAITLKSYRCWVHRLERIT
jgi:hypothetical protein